MSEYMYMGKGGGVVQRLLYHKKHKYNEMEESNPQ